MCTKPAFYFYLALDCTSYFSGIWEVWKHNIGPIFASRDVILGVVGELDSWWFVLESLNHDSFWSPVLSTHPWKRQKVERVFCEQGREAKDFFVPCDPAEGRQPWFWTSLGKSSGHTPPLQNVWQCSNRQTGKPQKGKQYAALPQRSYQLIKGILNTFRSVYWYSSLLFSSHSASVPK